MEEAYWELFAGTGLPVFYLLYRQERELNETAKSAWTESGTGADPA